MRHVELRARSKPASLREPAARAKSATALFHVGARHLARHLDCGRENAEWATRETSGQLAVSAAARCRLPTAAASRPSARHARAARRSPPATSRWTKSTMRFHAAACSGRYRPAHHGEMRASRDTSVISAITKPGAAHRAAAEMHQVPVADTPVVRRRTGTSARRRRGSAAPGRAAGTA